LEPLGAKGVQQLSELFSRIRHHLQQTQDA